MRTVRNAFLVLAAAIAFAGPVLADADPSVQQIYDEAAAGRLDHAQQMIDQVLADHPRSARAHYVAAELAAREGKLGVARSQLSQAEQLNPGLPFAKPQAIEALKAQLSERHAAGAMLLAPQQPQHAFPWGPVLLLGGLVLFVVWLVRRRSAAVPVQYPGGAYSGAGVAGGPGPYGPGGYGPGYGAPMGGGIGSGIAGGLASGLAVGAGVVAGEELAHHFLDGDRHEGSGVQPVYTEVPPASNNDMGGNDFGMNDSSGWDDSGGGGFGDGGGGGDWS
jgi:hypothetical protein